MPASKRASPITSAARGLGSEGWWDTHFRAQVAPRRRASQAYLAELLKTSDAPRGESESLKECTFKPKLRKKKRGGGVEGGGSGRRWRERRGRADPQAR